MTATQIIIKTILNIVATYFVYKDSKKNNIRHANFWIIGTFLFLPTAIVYFIYKSTAGKKTKLSKRQLVELEVKKRRKAELEKIALERSKLDNVENVEKEQNQEILAELEELRAKRKAEKEAKMKELREERLEQQKEHARKMKVSLNTAKEKMHIDD